jgi:hypothetical protein
MPTLEHDKLVFRRLTRMPASPSTFSEHFASPTPRQPIRYRLGSAVSRCGMSKTMLPGCRKKPFRAVA